jgi:hypothetical protein
MKLSEGLEKIIVNFCLGETLNVDSYTEEMIDFCMEDKNSSALRELVTTKIAGYTPIEGKLGRDAVDASGKQKECKPKNYNGTTAQRGGACFNDYTQSRLDKDIAEDLDIVGSLFINKQCAYVVEYSIHAVKDKLQKQIHDKCVVKSNAYVRSASWAYDSYIDHNSLKVHFINKDLILDNPKAIVKPFRDKLVALAEDS